MPNLPSGLTLIDTPKGQIPPGLTPVGQPEDEGPGVVGKGVGRFLGTDVEDPLPWTRLGTVIAGAIGGAKVGATGGAALGTPGGPVGVGAGAVVGGAAGALAGTAAGVVAPELAMELGEALNIFEPGTRERVGLSNEQLKTVLEGELILESATMGGVAAARLAGRGLSRAFTQPGRRGRQLAEDAARHGINMLPVQVGNRTLPRQFVSVMGRFPFVGGPIRRRGQQADRALSQAFASLPTRIAMPASMSEVSADIFNDVRGLANDINNKFQREYEQVFDLADTMGVKLRPTGTIGRVDEVLAEINKKIPAAGVGRRRPAMPDNLRGLAKFLTSAVSPMRGDLVQGAKDKTGIAQQSLRQMDTLLANVDTMIGRAVQKNDQEVLDYLTRVRQAVQKDMLTLGRGRIGPGGTAPAQIGQKLADIDQRFSGTLADVFENAVAKRFASVNRRGMGGIVLNPQQVQATATSMDNLADILLRGGTESTVDDLAKIIEPDTMRRLTASVLDRTLNKSMEIGDNGGMVFNVDTFARDIGLGKPNSPEYLKMNRLLQASGGLPMEDVQTLVNVGRQLASVEIPDVSTFVARRATMGGARAIATILPGMQVAAGTAAGRQVGFNAGTLIAGLTGIIGANAISRLISQPDNARALRYVLRNETSRVGRRAAWIKAARGVTWGMMEAGNWTIEEVRAADQIVDSFAAEIQKFEEQPDTYEELRAAPLKYINPQSARNTPGQQAIDQMMGGAGGDGNTMHVEIPKNIVVPGDIEKHVLNTVAPSTSGGEPKKIRFNAVYFIVDPADPWNNMAVGGKVTREMLRALRERQKTSPDARLEADVQIFGPGGGTMRQDRLPKQY